MSSTNSRVPVAAALGVSAALVLAACGSGDASGGEYPADDGRTIVDELVPFSSAPEAIGTPEAGETAADHFEAMINDLVERTAGDNRIVDAEMVDLLSNRAERQLPDLVINVLSAAGSVRTEIYEIIAAYSEVGAAAGYDEATTGWFEARAVPARALSEQFGAALDIVGQARQLELPGRLCFTGDDRDDRGCQAQPEAVALLDQLDTLAQTDIELPNDVNIYEDPVDESDLELLAELGLEPNPVNACDAWTAAVADQPADAVLLFERSIDVTSIDSKFIGRSECRRIELGTDDIEVDMTAGAAAFAAMYSALAAVEPEQQAESESLFPITADQGTLDYVRAGSASAREQFEELTEPNARLAMISIVLRAERELVKADLLEGATESESDEAFGCADLEASGEDWLAGCDDDQRALAEYGLLHGEQPWIGFFLVPVDWRDVDRAISHCAVWAEQLESFDDDRRRSDQMFTVQGLFGIDDC